MLPKLNRMRERLDIERYPTPARIRAPSLMQPSEAREVGGEQRRDQFPMGFFILGDLAFPGISPTSSKVTRTIPREDLDPS